MHARYDIQSRCWTRRFRFVFHWCPSPPQSPHGGGVQQFQYRAWTSEFVRAHQVSVGRMGRDPIDRGGFVDKEMALRRRDRGLGSVVAHPPVVGVSGPMEKSRALAGSSRTIHVSGDVDDGGRRGDFHVVCRCWSNRVTSVWRFASDSVTVIADVGIWDVETGTAAGAEERFPSSLCWSTVRGAKVALRFST